MTYAWNSIVNANYVAIPRWRHELRIRQNSGQYDLTINQLRMVADMSGAQDQQIGTFRHSNL